jgi:hypothetical protein
MFSRIISHTNRNFTDIWAVIFDFINENSIWPKLSEMFEVTNKGDKIFGTALLDRETSDRDGGRMKSK